MLCLIIKPFIMVALSRQMFCMLALLKITALIFSLTYTPMQTFDYIWGFQIFIHFSLFVVKKQCPLGYYAGPASL